MSNGYRYTGSGERYACVPARDLTQEEYDRLGPLEQRTVDESEFYKPKPTGKADKPAAKTADKGDE